MAITSYTDIYSGKTQDQLIAEMLARFPAGWPINDWSPGGTERTNLEMDSFFLADLYTLAGIILAGGYLDSATGDWLSVLAWSFFQETRNAAIFTEGHAVLTVDTGAAPLTIIPGQLWLQDADGFRFSNTTGGTVDDMHPLTIGVRAEIAGAAYNIPTGSMILLGTPLPGLRCNNPVYPAITGSTWVSQFGSDEENDSELRKKCSSKWGAQGAGGPKLAYYYWARKADPVVKKVAVFTNYLAGRAWAGGLTLYLAGDAGPVDATVVSNVKTYVLPLCPPMARLDVQSAVGLRIAVSGPVLLSADANDADKLAIGTRLNQYAVDLEIGEKVFQSEVIGAVVFPPKGKIRDYKPTSPGGDVQPYRNQVVSFDPSGLTYST